MALLSVAARRRRRQVRQFFWTLAKVVAAAAVLGFTAFSAFEVGTARNAAERRLLEQEAEQREARMQELAEAEATAVERARRPPPPWRGWSGNMRKTCRRACSKIS